MLLKSQTAQTTSTRVYFRSSLPKTIVFEFAVTGHDDQPTGAGAQGIEYLCGSFAPYLQFIPTIWIKWLYLICQYGIQGN